MNEDQYVEKLTTPGTGAIQRVAHGAALLDDRLPGWRERVNEDVLDLANGTRCVLGQIGNDLGLRGTVWGFYGRMRQLLFGEHEGPEAYDHGFTPFKHTSGAIRDSELAEGRELTRLWRKVMAKG